MRVVQFLLKLLFGTVMKRLPKYYIGQRVSFPMVGARSKGIVVDVFEGFYGVPYYKVRRWHKNRAREYTFREDLLCEIK